MLDIKYIRDNAEAVKAAVKNKGLDKKINVDSFLKIDEQRTKELQELEDLRAQRNSITDKIKSDPENRDKLLNDAKGIKDKINGAEEAFKKIDEEYENILLAFPNITSPKMPVGKDESENVSIRKWGEIKKFDFTPLDHVELGKNLDLIDTEKAAEVSGARFYYLKNEAVLMQFGIIQLVLTTLRDPKVLSELAKKVNNPSSKEFSPIIPPVLMKPEVMKKMDRLDPVDERFRTKLDDFVLVGSAEHTLGPMHMNDTFEEKDLPVRYIGYSTAFRREAGSYGKDTKGILRVHQFDKLEMETFVTKEMGEVEQDFIVAIQEYLVQQLEIPYQVIQICTGDTGKPDYNQYDIECWVPSQNKYRETHTSDYMTDFQSRRLNIKYKTKEGEKEYVHMNDATAFAIGRALIAILENNQQKDGSVVVPKVLVPYVGKEVIKPK